MRAYRLAVFVTPHGFGHATRICAVLEALRQAAAPRRIEVELFTTVPTWLFEDCLGEEFGYHPTLCDIGLFQNSAIEENVGATLGTLRNFLEDSPNTIDQLAREVDSLGCDRVLCDVSPLGLAVAKQIGLPSTLIENFVWSWVYQTYSQDFPELARIAEAFESWEALASDRISVQPNCCETGGFQVAPVFRKPRLGRAETRRQLDLSNETRMVVWTMGGIPWDFGSLAQLEIPKGIALVVPGGSDSFERQGDIVLLPHHSDYYHPDLMAASDGVIGKLGYSTIAEVWSHGVPMAYIPRPNFPESAVLSEFARNELRGLEIGLHSLSTKNIGPTLAALLAPGSCSELRVGGAVPAAARILESVQLTSGP